MKETKCSMLAWAALAAAFWVGDRSVAIAAGWTVEYTVGTSSWSLTTDGLYAGGSATAGGGAPGPLHAQVTGLVYYVEPWASSWVTATAVAGMNVARFQYEGMNPVTCPVTVHASYQHQCNCNALATDGGSAEAWTHQDETGMPAEPAHVWAPLQQGQTPYVESQIPYSETDTCYSYVTYQSMRRFTTTGPLEMHFDHLCTVDSYCYYCKQDGCQCPREFEILFGDEGMDGAGTMIHAERTDAWPSASGGSSSTYSLTTD
ncbi:MAG: hypothetical protein GW911_32230 [Armatimonadetes bacterium]|nr:hypothetical protein [Armatimonadota bacterium]